VKICGTTRLQDAELAVQLGAWAIGMIFYDASPRSCSLIEAEAISRALRRKVELCGVFVNGSLETITAIAEQLHLSIIQLHGDEGQAFCNEVARRTGAKVCKAVQIAAAGDVRALEGFHVDFHLVDGKGKAGQRGGTGQTFDWSLLRARRGGRLATPLILSGGLNPDNVAAAIEAVKPFAVDVASGVEQAPGRKDEMRLRDFFAAVEGVGADTSPAAEQPAAPSAGTDATKGADAEVPA
jgi:phosphoribosylanthranilate isomerase